MNMNDWISVKERLPNSELSNESSLRKEYKSQNVLIQTKRDEIYSAYYIRSIYKNKKYKEEMLDAAKNLQFERAAELRDIISDL